MNEQQTRQVEPMAQQPQVSAPAQPLYQPGNNQMATASAYAGYDLTAQQPVSTPPSNSADVSVDWEASEYIHHDKGALWIVCLVAAAAVLVAIAVWLQIWTFAILIVIMAIAMGVFAFRPPRVLHYKLNSDSLTVDDKLYNLADFRAFGILSEGAFYTIMLLPAKRFMPAVNVFFAEQDGEKIVDILGVHLPMEQLHLDMVDRLMRQLRF